MIAQFSLYALDALLIVNLLYSVVLLRRMKVFRVHEKDMRKVVDDIMASTETARDIISKLKHATYESQSGIDDQIERGRQFGFEFERRVADAKLLLDHIIEAERNLRSKKASVDTQNLRTPPERTVNHDHLDDIGDLAKILRNKLVGAR